MTTKYVIQTRLLLENNARRIEYKKNNKGDKDDGGNIYIFLNEGI